MRTTFIESLSQAARENPDIWLLCGDLGYSVLEPFAAEFPERYLNVGVAEQNMAGIAAGIALSGKTVFIYSIGNFPTLRCLEQLRNDVCYHGADVKVVAVNIIKVQPKPKRRGLHRGMRPGWKKAVVQLRPGDTIEIFEGAQI